MSIGKHLYFLIFVDSISGLAFICLADAKSQTCKMMNCPRSANAKEFLSSAFNVHVTTQGTVLEAIQDCTPELNGTTERNIRTVKNRMRLMLKEPDCPKIYGLKP